MNMTAGLSFTCTQNIYQKKSDSEHILQTKICILVTNITFGSWKTAILSVLISQIHNSGQKQEAILRIKYLNGSNNEHDGFESFYFDQLISEKIFQPTMQNGS